MNLTEQRVLFWNCGVNNLCVILVCWKCWIVSNSPCRIFRYASALEQGLVCILIFGFYLFTKYVGVWDVGSMAGRRSMIESSKKVVCAVMLLGSKKACWGGFKRKFVCATWFNQ